MVQERIFEISNADINIHRFLIYSDVLNKYFDSFTNILFGAGFGTYLFENPIDNQIFEV